LSSCYFFKFFKKEKDLDKKLVYSLAARKIPNSKQLRYLKKFLRPKEYLIIKICLLLIAVNLVYLSVIFIRKHVTYIPSVGGQYSEGIVGYPKNINPLYASSRDVDNDLSRLIYSSLFAYSDQGKLVKDLVTNIEIKNNGKEYIIEIKKNVFWHDGKKLTADDVLFTFNLIKNENYHSPLQYSLAGVKAKKINNYTVKFILSETYAPFPELLTFGILPKNIWENIDADAAMLSELNLKPIGSGPYQFKSLLKNKNGYVKEYHLIANKNYYSKKPYFKDIIFKFYTNYSEAINALNNNQISGLSYLPWGRRKELLTQDSLYFYELKLPQIVSIFFNPSQNKDLGVKGIRQALAIALDKSKIIDEVFSGIYSRADGPIPKNSFAYDNKIKIYKFDPAKAKQVLYDEDLTINLTVIDVNNNVALAKEIKKYWEQAKVKVNLKIVSSNEASDIIKNRNFEALIYGQTIGGDPDVYAFWHSSQGGSNGLNLAGYDNSGVDKLLIEARSTTNQKERIDRYKQFQEKITNDLPAIFLYSPVYTYLHSKKIKGFTGTAIVEPADRFSGIANWYRKTNKKFIW